MSLSRCFSYDKHDKLFNICVTIVKNSLPVDVACIRLKFEKLLS